MSWKDQPAWAAAGKFALVASVLGGGVYVATMLYDLVQAVDSIATKEYHQHDTQLQLQRAAEQFGATIDEKLKPVQASADESLSNTLPPRILNILQIRCSNPAVYEQGTLPQLLERLLESYKRVVGREYQVGTCNADGVYVDVYGRPQPAE